MNLKLLLDKFNNIKGDIHKISQEIQVLKLSKPKLKSILEEIKQSNEKQI